MLFLLLVIFFVNLSFAAKKDCKSEHSTFYIENYNKTSVSFFVKESYAYSDPCLQISNRDFRKLYPQLAIGRDVEHIIDNENSEPELSDCDKSIMGNLILATLSWNRGVGALCWEYAKIEKSTVYGNIFERAMYNVRSCCGMDMPTRSFTLTPTYQPIPSLAPTASINTPTNIPIREPSSRAPTIIPKYNPVNTPTILEPTSISKYKPPVYSPTNAPTHDNTSITNNQPRENSNLSVIMLIISVCALFVPPTILGFVLWYYYKPKSYKIKSYDDLNL